MTDPGVSAEPQSLIASAKGAFSTFLEILHTRLRLLGMDLEEQGYRLLMAFLLGFAALFLFLFALVGIAMLIVLTLWQSYGAWAVVTLLLLIIAVGMVCARLCARTLRVGPRPFSASIAELEKDLARLRGGT